MRDDLNIHFAVVGAGLAGSLLAVYLAGQGHRVDVYERRADPRVAPPDEGRSINLGLSARGIGALRKAGLWDSVRAHTVPMRGRYVHPKEGRPFFHPYGRDPGQILYSIRRDALSRTLVEHAEKLEGVRFFFETPVSDIDRDGPSFRAGGETITPDVIVGADGAFSTVRSELLRGRPADFRQEFLPWGYKELHLPFTERLEALHVWPGEQGLMVAHPNIDGSLTCTLFMDHSDLQRPDLAAYVKGALPAADLPDLPGQLARSPIGHLVTVRTSRWHENGRVVLIGDACHAVYPFYGQGMNSAFEDCVVLAECVEARPGDTEAAFATYQRRRKPHTDVLADLSADNFVELRDRLRSPLHLARKQVDAVLSRLLPDLWRPLYTMVSHTTMPYGEALRRARTQDRIVRAGGMTAAVGLAVALFRRRDRRHQK